MKKIGSISALFLCLIVGIWGGLGYRFAHIIEKIEKTKGDDFSFEIDSINPWRHTAYLKNIKIEGLGILESKVKLKYHVFTNSIEMGNLSRFQIKDLLITAAPKSNIIFQLKGFWSLADQISKGKNHFIELIDSTSVRFKEINLSKKDGVGVLSVGGLRIKTDYENKDDLVHMHYNITYKDLEYIDKISCDVCKMSGEYSGKIRIPVQEFQDMIAGNPTKLSYLEFRLLGTEKTPWAQGEGVFSLEYRDKGELKLNGKVDVDFNEKGMIGIRKSVNMFLLNIQVSDDARKAFLIDFEKWASNVKDLGRVTFEYDVDVDPFRVLSAYSGLRRLNLKLIQKDFLWEFKGVMDNADVKGETHLFYSDMPKFIERTSDLASIIAKNFYPSYEEMIVPETRTLQEIVGDVARPTASGTYKQLVSILFQGNILTQKQTIFFNDVPLEALAVKYVLAREKNYRVTK